MYQSVLADLGNRPVLSSTISNEKAAIKIIATRLLLTRPTLAYWQSADKHERANGTLFRQVMFALPKELAMQEQTHLADQFAKKLCRDQCLPYSFAVHDIGKHNPHCHLIISERMNDGIARSADTWFRRTNKKNPERGGAVKADIGGNRKEWLEATRKSWEQHANHALEMAGHETRIDHRSLEDQGIDRIPTKHLGHNVIAMERKGIKTDRMAKHKEIKRFNAAIVHRNEVRKQIRDEIRNNPEKLDRLVKADHDQKEALAKDKVERAEKATQKIRQQETRVKQRAANHDQARPDQPKWYEFAGAIYERALQQWKWTREQISDWAEERLQTFGKRLEKIKPYLNYEFSLSKATEQINNKDLEMARLYEEHKAKKEKERQLRAQENRKKREKERQQKKQERMERLKKKRQERSRGGFGIGD